MMFVYFENRTGHLYTVREKFSVSGVDYSGTYSKHYDFNC